ncbi:MAG: hypothetical protein BWZ10_02227 [candidate division BRC1 bacterium ADurb.BinA364]|nr:MAG: hypothetical protein BWZ10_02227 [candidate division BRC1 bacterium ADurb.BinA364]
MSFLAPLSFAFALVLPLIVLMYLLRLRRQRVPISSILLWRKTLEDLQANAPFQKLRNNLLLWLQLLAALLAVLALARPTMRLAPTSGKNYIVLMDTSASMQTREVEGRRIDQAKRALQAMIDNLGRGDRMMIVAFDGETRVAQTFTESKAELSAAARGLEARDSVTRARNAMVLARSVAEGLPAGTAEAVIIGDGAIADLDQSPDAMPPVRFLPVGSTSENWGITRASLRQTFDRDADRELFVTVENQGLTAGTNYLQCFIGGELADAKEIALGGGESQAVLFSQLGKRQGPIELRLRDSDYLAVDDVARGVLPEQSKLKILLVSSGNFFLEKALAGSPRCEVYSATPGQYAASEGYDITVFDNFAPARMGPGAYLMINALPPLEGFKAGPAPLPLPSVIDWNRVHPLMRYAKFDLVNIERAIDVTAPSWIQTLAEGEVSPLLFALERDQRQIVVVAFDLFESDWPLRISFPIFLNNCIAWLARMTAEGQSFAFAAGETVPFAIPPGLRTIEIETPSGAKRTLDAPPGQTAFFAQTNETGFYKVNMGNEAERLFAVNLLSAEESAIAPQTELALRDQQVVGDASMLKSNREIWHWLALAALIVLAVEWLIYCRRTWL